MLFYFATVAPPPLLLRLSAVPLFCALLLVAGCTFPDP
jgi:hypothetical protein